MIALIFKGNYMLKLKRKRKKTHCVKSVRIRNYSGPYFPAFGLNTERYTQSECGKTRIRITPNKDTLYAVTIDKDLVYRCYKFLRNV